MEINRVKMDKQGELIKEPLGRIPERLWDYRGIHVAASDTDEEPTKIISVASSTYKHIITVKCFSINTGKIVWTRVIPAKITQEDFFNVCNYPAKKAVIVATELVFMAISWTGEIFVHPQNIVIDGISRTVRSIGVYK